MVSQEALFLERVKRDQKKKKKCSSFLGVVFQNKKRDI